MRLDQRGIDRTADAHAFRRVRPQVRKQGIRRGRHPLHDILAGVRAGVDRDRAFVEIDIVEIGTTDRAREVTGQRLELDNVGTEISEQTPARRAGDQVGDFEDADASQWQRIRSVTARHASGMRFRIVRWQVIVRVGDIHPRPFDPSRHFAQLDRHTHLIDGTDSGVLKCDDHLVVDDLRVRHALFCQPSRGEGHVGRFEVCRPLGLGPRCDNIGDHASKFHLRVFLASAALIESLFLNELADAHDPGSNGHEPDVYAAKLDVLAVAATINAIEGRAAGRLCLKRVFWDVLSKDFRVIEQRTRHHRCLYCATAACRLPCQQRRRDSKACEQSAADRRQRVHNVHRCGPEPGHAAKHTHACKNQIVDRRLVLQRAAFPKGGD